MARDSSDDVVGCLFAVIAAPFYPLYWFGFLLPKKFWDAWSPLFRRGPWPKRLVWLPGISVALYLATTYLLVPLLDASEPGAFLKAWMGVDRFVLTVVRGPFAVYELFAHQGRTIVGALAFVGLGLLDLFAASVVFLAPLFVWLGPRVQRRASSHGTAHWGGWESADNAGMLVFKEAATEAGGFMLGRFKLKRERRKYDLRVRTHRHVLTCAPTRTGKGVGCVIPHLLEYPGSCFVLDLKGENAAVTARRRRELQNQVAVIDPFAITSFTSSSVNWIDWLDIESPESISEAAAIADMLVLRDSDHDGHWNDSAQSFLQGMLLHVASLPVADRHPGTLRHLITLPETELLAVLGDIADNAELAHGIPARIANTMMQKADRERSGVISTAQRHTAFLDDPRIVESLKRSEVDFAKLKSELWTIYLVVPPDKLRSQSRFVRAVLYMALRGVLRVSGQPRHPVTYILDELAQLGHMSIVEDSVSLLAGYGALMWLLVQDLSQLKAVYPKWETFLANTTLQAFGTQDNFTARYLSEALGSETILVTSEQQSSSKSDHPFALTGSSSDGTSTAHHGRPLLMSDEIRRADNDEVFVLQQGQPPYSLTRLDYRTDSEFAGMADENPMYAAVSETADSD